MREQIRRRLRRDGVRLGEVIGSGGSKVCYELPDHPGYVGLCLDSGAEPTLRQEQRLLGRLRNLGVPTLRCYGVFRVRNPEDLEDDHREVLVCDRWDHHAFGGGISWDPERRQKYGPWLRPAHLLNLMRLRDRLYRRRIDVVDLQFLFRDDGEVCVADPSDIRFGNQGDTRSCIDALLRGFRQTLAGR